MSGIFFNMSDKSIDLLYFQYIIMLEFFYNSK